ncbi:MAG: MscL family protein [Patescibacteria group bacterium]
MPPVATPPQSFWTEFKAFIKEYQIVGLALAFIMGGASQSLVRSLVENMIMPFVQILVPDGWREATLIWGPLMLKWGAFLAEVINFIILALVVFLVAKKLLKEEKIAKK